MSVSRILSKLGFISLIMGCFVQAAGAQVGPPQNVRATQGTAEDITVTWDVPAMSGLSYNIYRSDFSFEIPCSGTPLASGLTASSTIGIFLNSMDTGNPDNPGEFFPKPLPGKDYYYWVEVQGGSCSAYALGWRPARPKPPTIVSLLPGSDRLTIYWAAPSDTTPPHEPLTHYRLFRATSDVACPASPEWVTTISTEERQYADKTVSAGVRYYYSMQSHNNTFGKDSDCTTAVMGYVPAAPAAPSNLVASDNFPDKVRVTWTLPAVNETHPVTALKLYRSTNLGSQCQGSPLATLGAGQVLYDDITAIPGQVYNYSVLLEGPGGLSACVADQGTAKLFTLSGKVAWPDSTPVAGVSLVAGGGVATGSSASDGAYTLTGLSAGTYLIGANKTGYLLSPSFANPVTISTVDLSGLNFVATCATNYVAINHVCIAKDALPGIPANLTASKGTSPDWVEVNWGAAQNAASYKLYRSQFSTSIGEALGTGITGTKHYDTTAVPGVKYFYTVKAINPFGESDFSNTDFGFRFDITGQSDSDGDGVSDAQEAIDQTNPTDPGSFMLHLKSPAFTKYNTFLDQWNFLELMASGTKNIRAKITLYSIDGQVIRVVNQDIAAQQQVDIDIHSLVNQKDTYGLIRIDFNNSEPGETLLGRLSNYRLNPDGGSYSFAFARELKNPMRGVAYATANSMDPQGLGYLVPNWAEVMNLESSWKGFSYRLYDQEGKLVMTKSFSIPPLGEADVQAGHEFGEGVYLVEVRPDDGAARYISTVARYSSNAKPGKVAKTYNYAFTVDARSGNGDQQFVPISTNTGTCWSQSSWVEVVNTREKPVNVKLRFRDSAGQIFQTSEATFAARSQFHYNGGILLAKNERASVELSANETAALLVQTLVYFNDCKTSKLQTAYASAGRIAGQDAQVGTFNSYLGIKSLLNIINGKVNNETLRVEVRSNGALLGEQDQGISSLGNMQLDMNNSTLFNTQPNQYGTVIVRSVQPRTTVGEVVRLRELKGEADFAMQTVVQ